MGSDVDPRRRAGSLAGRVPRRVAHRWHRAAGRRPPAIVPMASTGGAVAREDHHTDEGRVRTYSLPPLLPAGSATAANELMTSWEATGRPRLLEVFKEHVYGHSPPAPPGLKFVQLAPDAPVCRLASPLRATARLPSICCVVSGGAPWPVQLHPARGQSAVRRSGRPRPHSPIDRTAHLHDLGSPVSKSSWCTHSRTLTEISATCLGNRLHSPALPPILGLRQPARSDVPRVSHSLAVLSLPQPCPPPPPRARVLS